MVDIWNKLRLAVRELYIEIVMEVKWGITSIIALIETKCS